MTEQTEPLANKSQNVVYLYLCDGKACSEEDKKCCWTLNLPPDLTCRHTTNEEHSLAKKLRGLIPTKFDPFSENKHILVEHFDYKYAKKDALEKFLNSLPKKKDTGESNNDEEQE